MLDTSREVGQSERMLVERAREKHTQRVQLDGRGFAFAALSAALLPLGCRDHQAPSAGRADAAPTAMLPRYWLRDTALLDQPGGAEVRRVVEPALVELLPGGRVRSIAGAKESFEGSLPESTLKQPRGRKGLMLYAQRIGELHLLSPTGPLIGHLHSGAFVSVAADQGDWIAVGSPGFDRSDAVVAYAERSVLGPEPRPEIAPAHAEKGRSQVGLPVIFWFKDPTFEGSKPLPPDVVAYAPGDAERWFTSRESCEAARREAITAIERDGTAATRTGFHAMEAPWLY